MKRKAINKSVFIIFILLIPFLKVNSQETEKYKTFELLNIIRGGSNIEVDPGELSKDGEKYYFSGYDVNRDCGVVIVYQLQNNGEYEELERFDLNPNDEHKLAGQISVTDDELTIVFTGSLNNTWENNDLYIGNRIGKNDSFEISKLDELNADGEPDAYPWISGDGLRIYFTRNNIVYYSQRNSRRNKFNTPSPVRVSTDDIGDVISCWLTNDEKTIYFISGNIVYKANRKNLNKGFGKPELVTDEFSELGFISAFCISEKNNLAFMYYSGDSFNSINNKDTSSKSEYYKFISDDDTQDQDEYYGEDEYNDEYYDDEYYGDDDYYDEYEPNICILIIRLLQ